MNIVVVVLFFFSFVAVVVMKQSIHDRISIGLQTFVLFLFLLPPFVFGGELEAKQEQSFYTVVTLQDDVESSERVAREFAEACQCELVHVYRHALKGFALNVPSEGLVSVMNDPRVKDIVMDRRMKPVGSSHSSFIREQSQTQGKELSEQKQPVGISRVEADEISSNQDHSDVRVAVIDSGIEKDHPDLQENLQGGKNFISDKSAKWTDEFGHGTHVAGTIAARDNGQGVVGVAPEAQLYAVRVLSKGSGGMKEIIAGIDWVAGDQSPEIDVANMSLGGPSTISDGAFHQAIQGAVEQGVTFTVAAGNSNNHAKNFVPAKFEEAITVSAIADTDGKPGGKGPSIEMPNSGTVKDDTFAPFSNYGTPVDVTAPGVKVLSTWVDGTYKKISGTSMAAPHVAGVVAHVIGQHEDLTPKEIEKRLVRAGMPAPGDGWKNDPDNDPEPLVDAEEASNAQLPLPMDHSITNP